MTCKDCTRYETCKAQLEAMGYTIAEERVDLELHCKQFNARPRPMKEERPVTRRNLDGCYFRVERDGKWQNICFSDLTAEERNSVTNGRNAEWLKSLCYHLADRLQVIGNEFDIEGRDDYE